MTGADLEATAVSRRRVREAISARLDREAEPLPLPLTVVRAPIVGIVAGLLVVTAWFDAMANNTSLTGECSDRDAA